MLKPKPGVLRVVGANVYYQNPHPIKAVGIAVGTRAHSIGFSEGSVIAGHLPERRAYTAIVPDAGRYQHSIDALDCPMLVRRDLHLRHQSHTQVTDRLNPHVGIAPERTWTMVVYDAPFLGKGERVAHLAIHPNWVDGIPTARNGVARQYAASMPRLDALIALAKTLATVVVVTGDLNSREGNDKPFTTVYDVFRDHRLAVKTDGLDGVAYSRRLVLDDWAVIGEKRTRSDHPWLVADLRLKGKRP